MLSIYGTSTGSLSIVQEGKYQFSGRGYSTPPIVDVNGNVIGQCSCEAGLGGQCVHGSSLLHAVMNHSC